MSDETTESPRYSTDQVRRRRAFALRASVTLVVVIGLLFVVVFPVSAWLDQRASLGQAEQRLQILRRERQRLDLAAHRLQSDAEVERIAREKYGMVHPGEQAYVAVPGGPTTTTTTLPLAP